MRHIFGSLKKLTLSLSALSEAALEENESDHDTNVDEQTVRSNPILQRLMQITLKLESLDLHWYTLEGCGFSHSYPSTPYKREGDDFDTAGSVL